MICLQRCSVEFTWGQFHKNCSWICSPIIRLKLLPHLPKTNEWTDLPLVPHMRRWIVSALVEIMACRLDGAKPLPEVILTYNKLDPKEHISMKSYLKLKYCHSRKCIWICRLENGGHFFLGLDVLYQPILPLSAAASRHSGWEPLGIRHPELTPLGGKLRA